MSFGALAPLAAVGVLAQVPGKLARIALLDSTAKVEAMDENHEFWGAFLKELRGLGYVEGKSVAVQRWSGGGNIEGYGAVAKKVVAARPDIIVAFGSGMIVSIGAATKSIPIVAIGTIPPGLHAGYARPGGNVTGVHVSADAQVFGKQVEFLRQLTKPGARIAWLGHQNNWDSLIGQAARDGAKQAGLILDLVVIASPVDEAAIRAAFVSMAGKRFEGLYVSPNLELRPYSRLIAESAMAARLPSVSFHGGYTEIGMLLSYGPNLSTSFRRGAHYVDRILKGARVADLPIEQPTKFELAINLRTAKALGIVLPSDLLQRADRLVE
jgi:putative ABC transport system substrate-binding protein